MNRGRARNHTPRGRSPRSGGRSSFPHAHVGPDGPSYNDRSDENFQWTRKTSDHKSVSSTSKNPENAPTCGKKHQQNWSPVSVGGRDYRIGRFQNEKGSVALGSSLKENDTDNGSDTCIHIQSGTGCRDLEGRITQITKSYVNESGESDAISHELSHKLNISSYPVDEPEFPSKSGVRSGSSGKNLPQHNEASLMDLSGNRNSEHSDCAAMIESFDICLPRSATTVTLKPSLLVRNREKRNEIKAPMEVKKRITCRSGMVLLKNFLSMSDQVNIVKLCQKLGLGPGGFYQPGYRDGAKLHLKMMCLGKNWDPETSRYEDVRLIDGAKPPIIPNELNQLVKTAIQEFQSHIEKEGKSTRVEQGMSADICIVNFYSTSGKLGLHQDRDESEDSLHKCLPVISFSIGNSAEFLYGDQRDVDKADKVVLESGDVLIFGGKSRHIFHGVSSILPNTAPKALIEKTNLRPGRLNLTFRQY